jgi:hypothetical protein
MMRSKRGDLLAAALEERVIGDEECIGSGLGKRPE